MSISERYPAAELVLDDELLFDDTDPRRSTLVRRQTARPEQLVREGEVLAGKYRVERIPGRSGLGVIVQVRHLELGQEVTLKFLVPDACAYPEFVQRFVREARAAVKIQGEHVARVTDVGRLESGAPYMVREFLRGPDLAEVVRVRGPLPIPEAVDYIIQACEGVAEGHALGVVHRNLRPTTLVVTRRSDGTALVKVFDFAAAESLHVDPFTERAVSLVGTSAIMASLPYLSPEQVRDPHEVDVRSDVYSLGAILHELLTGTPVYSAETAPALLAMVAADQAPSIRNLRPEVPGEVDLIALRCLSKNRAIRYSSVAELALALRPFASLDSSASIEHIVRLAKRTSKLPAPRDSRPPQALPAAFTSVAEPAENPAPQRGRHGTLLMHPTEPIAQESFRPIGPDDDTKISQAAAYRAGVSNEPARYTPQPPPLRTLGPPPLRTPSQPARAASSPPPPPVAPAHDRRAPERRERSTISVPPPPARSSMSGLTRSWAVADEAPSAPLFTRKRLVGIGVVAAFASLGAVLAVRIATPHAGAIAPVAAARIAAPAPVPTPVAAPPPAPEPVVAASVAPPPVAAPSAVPAPAAPAPVAAAVVPVPVAAAPAPAPVARWSAPPKAKSVPRPAASAPVTSSGEDVYPDPAPVKTAPAEQKLARVRPSGGGLFDDTR